MTENGGAPEGGGETARTQSEQRAWYRVALVHQRAYRALAARLSTAALSVAQFDLLAQLVLAEPGRLTQSELAKRLLVTKGNISGMISRMEVQGTVRRIEDPNDKRSHRVAVTESGLKAFQSAQALQRELVEEMFQDLDTEDLENLDRTASRILERFQQGGDERFESSEVAG